MLGGFKMEINFARISLGCIYIILFAVQKRLF